MATSTNAFRRTFPFVALEPSRVRSRLRSSGFSGRGKARTGARMQTMSTSKQSAPIERDRLNDIERLLDLEPVASVRTLGSATCLRRLVPVGAVGISERDTLAVCRSASEPPLPARC
jgi:hypothetical protein